MRTIQLSDDALNRVQDNVKTAINPLLALPLSDGILLEDIDLVAGQDNEISHKLSRKYRLWFTVRKFQNADVWEDTSSNDTLFINLKCSANCKVSLWVA